MFITKIRLLLGRVALSGAMAMALVFGVVEAAHANAMGCISAPSIAPPPAPAAGSPRYPHGAVAAVSTDPVGPFPLGLVLPFPWNSIEGVWKMRVLNDVPSAKVRIMYFSFEVQSYCDGRRFIEVMAFDAKTHEITGRGIGVAEPNDRIVRSAMTIEGQSVMVFIREIEEQGRGSQPSEVKTVVTLRPFNGTGKTDRHMIATKISKLPFGRFVQTKPQGSR